MRAEHGNPVRVRSCVGRSADREESSTPERDKDNREANAGGGNATGNHDGQIDASCRWSWITGHRVLVAWARKRADAVR